MLEPVTIAPDFTLRSTPDQNVSLKQFLGTIHDFVMLNVITDTPAPRTGITQANDLLQQAFAK